MIDRFHDQLLMEVRTMNQVLRAIHVELRRMNDRMEEKKGNGEEEDKANFDEEIKGIR